MCFAYDALAPEIPADLLLPPIAGGAAAELLELESPDGTAFSASLAQTPESRGAAVVILPDVRGLYPFYTDLAERFAAAGHHAIAIDYFGRTAGLAPRDEDFDWAAHIPQIDGPRLREDIAVAADAVAGLPGADGVAVVGFCFGGLQTFLTAAAQSVAADRFVGFYGALESPRFTEMGVPAPKDLASRMRGPILGLFGGADEGIPQEQVDRFDAALEEADVEHEFVVYPGAPHSFFDRRYEEHAEACEDAWRRTLAFLAA